MKEETDMTKQEKDNRVPLWARMNLTLEEAAAYTGIVSDKLRELSNRESCDFVLWLSLIHIFCQFPPVPYRDTNAEPLVLAWMQRRSWQRPVSYTHLTSAHQTFLLGQVGSFRKTVLQTAHTYKYNS